jgi:hypothetical protein
MSDFADPNWLRYLMPTPYISRHRLLERLHTKFGADNFRVQVIYQIKILPPQLTDVMQLRLNRWTVFAPRELSSVRFATPKLAGKLLKIILGGD